MGVSAQVYNPVKWKTSVTKVSADEYDLTATAIIEKGWHLYSQSVPAGGPVPTKFTFKSNPSYLKKGNTMEDKGTVVEDRIFEMKIKYFSNKAVFKQRIKLKSSPGFQVKSDVEFMACDDTKCLPPKVEALVFQVK